MTPSRGFPGRKKSPPAPPGGGRPKRMGPRAIVVYCGLLLSLGAFSIDITLPFFGRMRDSLGASDAAAHATVTLYMFALAIGQLVFGSVSDRYGRRPVIVGGLALYAIGALVAFLAPTIGWVLAGRALQGLGGAVGPVIGTAAIDHAGPAAFFWYAAIISFLLGLFTFWRLLRRRRIDAATTLEEFQVYPTTSPAVYEWVPHTPLKAEGKPDGKPPQAGGPA